MADTNTDTDYATELRAGPITEQQMASHVNYINAAKAAVDAIAEVERCHREKFSEAELQAIAAVRKLLDDKQVPVCLIEVAAPKRRRRPGQCA